MKKKFIYTLTILIIFLVNLNSIKAANQPYQLIANYQIDGKTFSIILSTWYDELYMRGPDGKTYRIINSIMNRYMDPHTDYAPNLSIPNLGIILTTQESVDQVDSNKIYESGMKVACNFIYTKNDNGDYVFVAIPKDYDQAKIDQYNSTVEEVYQAAGVYNHSSFNVVKPTKALAFKTDATGYSAASKQMIDKMNELVNQFQTDCEGRTLSGEAKTKCENIYADIQAMKIETDGLEDAVNSDTENSSNEEVQNDVNEATQTQEVVEDAVQITNQTPSLATFDFSLKVGCDTVFGGENSEIGEWLKNVFRFIQFAGLALVIVLSSLDFIKVISGHKDDELKNAFSRTTKRFIAAALLFLAPVLVQFALDIAGSDLFTGDGKPLSICIDFYK